jgi:hypothetical protein
MIKQITVEGSWKEKRVIVECEVCHKEREVAYRVAVNKSNPIHRCISCATINSQTGLKRSEESKKNMREAQRKSHNGGVRFNQGRGYKQLIVDDYHPRKKDRKGGSYIFEHILVMEQKVGRFLEKHEIVHHIDKDKQNNNIENLHLFSGNNNKESAQMHNAAHESLEQVGIELYKLGLVKFVDGKYNLPEEVKQAVASLAASVL